MTSLLAKDAYLQNLARKICAQPSAEPQKRKWGGRTQDPKAAGSSKKKRRKMQKKFREQEATAAEHKARSLEEKSPAASRAKKPVVTEEEAASSTITGPAERRTPEADSLFALDVLRQRLHERIQEARGQGSTKELSPATLEKRRRRKQERERKKRKRKELRAKEKAAKVGPDEAATAPAPEEPRPEPQEQTGLIFNKVDVGAEEPASRAQRRREKRRQVKGGLRPLTGRNYRQLLERLRARRTRLEALREQDAGRARALQARMQWTQLLYKAEGVKIRDSEPQLRAALQRKEKRRAQRRRQWEKRTAHVVEKMQQRQDKRRQNLRKKKVAKAERRMEKARKKGRILPQDLERAGLA